MKKVRLTPKLVLVRFALRALIAVSGPPSYRASVGIRSSKTHGVIGERELVVVFQRLPVKQRIDRTMNTV